MSSSLVKIVVHLIFHVKTTSPLVEPDDLNRLFEYIGGIIRGVDGEFYPCRQDIFLKTYEKISE